MKMHRIALFSLVLVAALALATGCARKKGSASGGSKVGGLSTVYFDFDRSDIRGDQQGEMQGNADWLKDHAKTDVKIEGHCDERGTDEYNIALGNRRANSAKSYLVNLGAKKDQLSTISYGEEKPAATGSDEGSWAKNRRAEFVKK